MSRYIITTRQDYGRKKQKAFEEVKGLEAAFSKLTPYKQKEYLEYIHAAKREATKLSRMEKIKPLILQGSGLHDQYK